MSGCILSDNGKEFNNKLVMTLCEKLRIDKKFSSPYRPQTNGLVERTNQTLIAIISKYVFKYECDWDDCLSTIRFQYNIRPQEGLGYSPFELLFGRKPNTPFLKIKSGQEESPDERIKRISERQKTVMDKRRTLQKMKVKKNKNILKVKDVVLYRNILRKGKLEPRWKGPYIVIKVNKVGSCKIKNIENDEILCAHSNYLKRLYTNKEFELEKKYVEEIQEDLNKL